MKKLKTLLMELESKIENSDEINLQVSKSSVGWHIEHTLLVINVIITGLKNSNPVEYKWKFNLSRLFVFTLNKIPKGKGKAPDRVQPKNIFTTESLKNHLTLTSDKIKELNNLNTNQFIDHPVFGNLNLKSTIKFLHIHTHHHIEIIDDIIKTPKKV